MIQPETHSGKDLAILIAGRNRPDLADAMVEQLTPMGGDLTKDIFVVECGSEPEKCSRHATLRYDDPDFLGKCYGHHRLLEHVLEARGRYRHYWILMNDLVFEAEPDPIRTLVGYLDAEPRMGLISPTEPGAGYPHCKPQQGRGWRKVSTTDYLAVMIKDECLREVGFLNPDFKYCWGAIHELSYKMYSAGWFLAYCDRVPMVHLGGSTYGKASKTISRDEYKVNAKRWAREYFRANYGPDWDRRFADALPEGVPDNFSLHRRAWESPDAPPVAAPAPTAPRRGLRRLLRRLIHS